MTNRIIEDMPAETYHADPCDEPSLSAGVGNTLLKKTPKHAWCDHPRLNPDFEPTNKAAFDMGSAVHAMALGGSNLRLIDHDDYRTKAAKEARDAAYEAGKTPLNRVQMSEVSVIVTAAREQIQAHPDLEMSGGMPEATLVWQDSETGVWCRCRPDYLLPNGDIYDLKLTTSMPTSWDAHAFNMGYDVRVGHYMSGVKHCMSDIYDRNPGRDTNYLFINIERNPPHSLFVTALAPDALDMAMQKAAHATKRWAECLKTDHWPGWGDQTFYVSPPPWQLAQWEIQQFNEGQS